MGNGGNERRKAKETFTKTCESSGRIIRVCWEYSEKINNVICSSIEICVDYNQFVFAVYKVFANIYNKLLFIIEMSNI